ncbi:hypothetical protein CUR178_00765 [Leishmania enriettii]|uniref:Uncharacterized protein n=1 Tax=Leishmania enriettii TaxID=5663 RepID=A0A836G7Y2_LEIEN|nr:hypothetical protein CUR178_00765 [Leishmania enriettii]
MLHQKKQATTSRSGVKAAVPFDPVAYAASIAMSAAETRLRASHARQASSSTARPSSARRLPKEGALAEASQHSTAASFHTVSDSVTRCSSSPQLAAATAGSRTLLEELACTSDSSLSVDVHTPPKLTRAIPRNRTPADVTRSTSVHSPSPPAPFPSHISAHPTNLAGWAESRPLAQEKVRRSESDTDDDGAVSLRDASPLREHSVLGTTGIRYRTYAVESVHSIARQLNFALYQ